MFPLSYDEAYKLATAREEASKNATSTERIIPGTSSTESTHAVFTSRKKWLESAEAKQQHTEAREPAKRRRAEGQSVVGVLLL